jgi:hypothetical protein
MFIILSVGTLNDWSLAKIKLGFQVRNKGFRQQIAHACIGEGSKMLLNFVPVIPLFWAIEYLFQDVTKPQFEYHLKIISFSATHSAVKSSNGCL